MQIAQVDISNLYNPATQFSSNNPTITQLITSGGFNLLDVVFFIIAFLFFINLIITSFGYIFGGDDPESLDKTNTRLLNGFIGLVIVLASFLIVKLITSMLNYDSSILPF